jgi:hypothetical protein
MRQELKAQPKSHHSASRGSKDRELSSRWQRAAELLLAEGDVAAFSKAVELAFFYDAKFATMA